LLRGGAEMAGFAVKYKAVDGEYYDKTHLPLAGAQIGKWVKALRVIRGKGDFQQITLVDLKDGVTASEVLESAEMKAVTADMANFTDPQAVEVLRFE